MDNESERKTLTKNKKRVKRIEREGRSLSLACE